ncbi:fumarylacetoacetate hydrolase family protein [Thiomonas bhubaneswarensis]|uniref:2-keto-4-pentenoate hydratase/2-oxohepta-3-ene-1,7-dioic acid hydratase (Catechol pathway) n=1 Tax=Thiomonas bhubaneswarensis TaxID=339866 RepID=A0A0K6I555_9BURK|nr:fumarylacetoacetate hydrolase family protein [Thiomonas bhubaneswarensis]CUA98432.1 2-keto-4-pentenoate hydratase/2-oxohepta-3-ene-1,7-dioic acid hydratase (catechol pathway) [Thiomonas bhubaneswarensis]
MQTVFPPHSPALLPIVGSAQTYPVRRVYCVGRNYAAHAREMGSDPTREPPFFFCKPGDTDAVIAVPAGHTGDIAYPSATHELHHEIELVVALGKAGRDIAVDQAAAHIYGYAVGLDLTRRDLQGQMKAQGRPWEIGKAFDQSAPVGPITPRQTDAPPMTGTIALSVDGTVRQQGRLEQMIWSVDETIARLSTLFTLKPGDLIFTGTPDGVGAISRGQILRGEIEGLTPLQVRIV